MIKHPQLGVGDCRLRWLLWLFPTASLSSLLFSESGGVLGPVGLSLFEFQLCKSQVKLLDSLMVRGATKPAALGAGK